MATKQSKTRTPEETAELCISKWKPNDRAKLEFPLDQDLVEIKFRRLMDQRHTNRVLRRHVRI